MHKIHNSGINIFGFIPLCQFYDRARAGDTCVPRNTQFQFNLRSIYFYITMTYINDFVQNTLPYVYFVDLTTTKKIKKSQDNRLVPKVWWGIGVRIRLLNLFSIYFSFYLIHLILATNGNQEQQVCKTQFSHESVWSLQSYVPLTLQKWAKNVNKLNNSFSFQLIYLKLATNLYQQLQMCTTQFSHG